MKAAVRSYPLGFVHLMSAAFGVAIALCAPRVHAAWEPSAPVELVVPAGTGGGADQMARFIQQMVVKLRDIPTSLQESVSPIHVEALVAVPAVRTCAAPMRVR